MVEGIDRRPVIFHPHIDHPVFEFLPGKLGIQLPDFRFGIRHQRVGRVIFDECLKLVDRLPRVFLVKVGGGRTVKITQCLPVAGLRDKFARRHGPRECLIFIRCQEVLFPLEIALGNVELGIVRKPASLELERHDLKVLDRLEIVLIVELFHGDLKPFLGAQLLQFFARSASRKNERNDRNPAKSKRTVTHFEVGQNTHPFLPEERHWTTFEPCL